MMATGKRQADDSLEWLWDMSISGDTPDSLDSQQLEECLEWIGMLTVQHHVCVRTNSLHCYFLRSWHVP